MFLLNLLFREREKSVKRHLCPFYFPNNLVVICTNFYQHSKIREHVKIILSITELSTSRHYYHRRLLQTKDNESSKYAINDVNVA